MVERPSSHVTGDYGVAAVSQMFIERGWTCDRVYSDYGEDLVIQTTLAGRLDPFRTLAQIKTRTKVPPRKRLLRIPRELALRWIRNAEPVLLVLWDFARNRGWYALPHEDLSEHDLLLSAKKTATISLPDENTVMPKRLDELAWALRLTYFGKRMLAAEQHDTQHLLLGSGESRPKRRELGTVVFEFLRTIGIFSSRGISQTVRGAFRNAKRNIADTYRSQGDDDTSIAEIELNAACLVLIAHIQRLTGVGVPPTILVFATPYLLHLLKIRSFRVLAAARANSA